MTRIAATSGVQNSQSGQPQYPVRSKAENRAFQSNTTPDSPYRWYDAAMLRTRQLIPPLNLHTPDGRTVRAWDFKQKKNLVIAFLDLECAPCEEFFRALAVRAAELREKEAVALIAFLSPLPERLSNSLPEETIAGADISGRGARAYLGDDAFASRGLAHTGAFVADRYGELFAQWISGAHKFPPMEEVFSWVEYLGMACDECSVPEWPADA
jgi:hypothetical protein